MTSTFHPYLDLQQVAHRLLQTPHDQLARAVGAVDMERVARTRLGLEALDGLGEGLAEHVIVAVHALVLAGGVVVLAHDVVEERRGHLLQVDDLGVHDLAGLNGEVEEVLAALARVAAGYDDRGEGEVDVLLRNEGVDQRHGFIRVRIGEIRGELGVNQRKQKDTFSQSRDIMPPSGSTILMPLSISGLWDAVTMRPIAYDETESEKQHLLVIHASENADNAHADKNGRKHVVVHSESGSAVDKLRIRLWDALQVFVDGRV